MESAVYYQQRIGEILSPVLHAITVHEKYIQMKIIGSCEEKVRELWQESISDKNNNLFPEDIELIKEVLRAIVDTRISMQKIEIPIVSNAVWKYIGELDRLKEQMCAFEIISPDPSSDMPHLTKGYLNGSVSYECILYGVQTAKNPNTQITLTASEAKIFEKTSKRISRQIPQLVQKYIDDGFFDTTGNKCAPAGLSAVLCWADKITEINNAYELMCNMIKNMPSDYQKSIRNYPIKANECERERDEPGQKFLEVKFLQDDFSNCNVKLSRRECFFLLLVFGIDVRLWDVSVENVAKVHKIAQSFTYLSANLVQSAIDAHTKNETKCRASHAALTSCSHENVLRSLLNPSIL